LAVEAEQHPFHLGLYPLEARGIQTLGDRYRRPDDDGNARRRQGDDKPVPFDLPRARGGIGHGNDGPLRQLREQDRAWLELPRRPARAIRRDGRRDTLVRQRLIVVAQRARAGVARGTADHFRAETPHDDRGEFTVHRGADQEPEFHARAAQFQQLFDAKQLVLMPIHGDE